MDISERGSGRPHWNIRLHLSQNILWLASTRSRCITYLSIDIHPFFVYAANPCSVLSHKIFTSFLLGNKNVWVCERLFVNWMGCKISQWRKSPNFLRLDVVFFKTHLLNYKKLCFSTPLWASYLIYCVYFSKHWPHDVIIFTKVLVHSLSWPLVGQLQIMSQFFWWRKLTT